MSVDETLLFWVLISPLLVIGIIGYFIHQRSYRELYRKLSARNLVGTEYRPDWSSALGSLACMGFTTKLKREIGVDALTDQERALLKRTTLSYKIGVPAIFVFTCAVFWNIYWDA